MADAETTPLGKKSSDQLAEEREALFKKATDADTLSLEDQASIRRYLYVLILSITGSLVLESINWYIAEYDWDRVAIAVAYIANAVKLYAIVHCLVSLRRFHGCLAFFFLIFIGPVLSFFLLIYDFVWYKRQEKENFANTNIVSHQYIKHFENSKVAIAALTAFCGVLDGIAGLANEENGWIGWVLGIYGATCLITGLIELFKLRRHQDFTFKKIICSPCTLWNITHQQYHEISDPTETAPDQPNEDSIDIDTSGQNGHATEPVSTPAEAL